MPDLTTFIPASVCALADPGPAHGRRIRILFGAVLGILVACPPLLAAVLAVTAAALSQPAVLAFTAGILLWPRINRRIQGWSR